MGLDMYLTASKYIGGWDHSSKKEQDSYKDILKGLGINKSPCQDSPWATLDICVAYWRKANAIHSWFVTNAQEGKDDCQRYYVSREQLKTLKDLCQQILTTKESKNSKKLAEQLLPPQSGFFFGSTAIDEYYKADLKLTVEQIDKILNNPKLESFDLHYQSSW